MDEIQKVLIKAGRKDLAQEYYKKIANLAEKLTGAARKKATVSQINEARKLLTSWIKQKGKNEKLIRKEVLNYVNSRYVRVSNQQVEIMWQEFNKIFPS